MKHTTYKRLRALPSIALALGVVFTTPLSALALVVNVPPVSTPGSISRVNSSSVRPAIDPISRGSTPASSSAGDSNTPNSTVAGNTSVNVPPPASHNPSAGSTSSQQAGSGQGNGGGSGGSGGNGGNAESGGSVNSGDASATFSSSNRINSTSIFLRGF